MGTSWGTPCSRHNAILVASGPATRDWASWDARVNNWLEYDADECYEALVQAELLTQAGNVYTGDLVRGRANWRLGQIARMDAVARKVRERAGRKLQYKAQGRGLDGLEGNQA